MTQETAHTPLDERARRSARFWAIEATSEGGVPGDEYIDGIIRAYLQTAAADVSGLVEEIHEAEWWQRGDENGQVTVSIAPERVAEAYQTLSARNAALEAEIERLRDKVDGLEADLDNAVETAFSRGAVEWTQLNYPKHYARLAALSAPKGGQDRG